MKKVVKYICLLIVAALVAILIMRNGAKADSNVTVKGPDGGITAGDKLSVTITFPRKVTSYSNGKVTATYVDGGKSQMRDGLVNINGPHSNTLVVEFNEPLEEPGKVNITVEFEEIVYEGGDADNCSNVTCEVLVNDKEPDVPDFKFGIMKSTIEVGEETLLTIDPPTDDVKYTMDPMNGVVTIGANGTVKAEKVGSTNIKATIKGVEKGVYVQVIEKSKPEPETPSVKIDFANGTNSIKVNETVKVNAIVTPSDAGITYSSSNESIATVDASGTVIGKGEGTAKITAKISVDGVDYNSNELSVTVTEDNQTPEPTPSEGEVPSLTPSNVTLEAYYKETTVTSNIPVTWKSSDSNIAAVERINDLEARIISANKAGNCSIIATAVNGGKTASINVSVVKPKNEDTKEPVLSPSANFKMNEGTTITMSADVDVTWESDNTSVATIDKNSGTITAKSAGTAKITATSKSNGKSTSVTVTVNAASNGNESGNGNSNGNNNGENQGGDNGNETFKLTPSKAQTLKVGNTLQLKASKPVGSWKSSKPNVASVDKNGKVTAISAGTAYISAVAIDSSVAQIKVTVKEDGSVSTNTTGNVTSGNSSSEVGEEVPATGESTTEMLIIVGAITLTVATVLFRKKTK